MRDSRLDEALANGEVGRSAIEAGQIEWHYDGRNCQCQTPGHAEPETILSHRQTPALHHNVTLYKQWLALRSLVQIVFPKLENITWGWRLGVTFPNLGKTIFTT